MYPLLQPTGLLSVPQSKFQLIFANEDGFTLRGSQLVRWIYQLGDRRRRIWTISSWYIHRI